MGPLHLLPLDHPFGNHLVNGRLYKGRGDRFFVAVFLTVVGHHCPIVLNVRHHFPQQPVKLFPIFIMQFIVSAEVTAVVHFCQRFLDIAMR